jgi:hypothetical protein
VKFSPDYSCKYFEKGKKINVENAAFARQRAAIWRHFRRIKCYTLFLPKGKHSAADCILIGGGIYSKYRSTFSSDSLNNSFDLNKVSVCG